MLAVFKALQRRLLAAPEQDERPRFSLSRYQRQRRMGFGTLSFVPSLEREYLDVYFVLNRLRMQLTHPLGMLGVIGFVVYDRYVGEQLQPRLGELLLLGMLVGLGLPLVASAFPAGQRHIRALLFAGLMLMAQSLVLAIWVGRRAAPDFPYESMMLVLLYLYFMAPIPLRHAAACGLSALILHLVLSYHALETRPQHLGYETYYLVLANLVGVVGRYLTEYEERTRFLLQRELTHHAQRDPLTGALNRRAFAVHAERVWAQAAREQVPVGLMILDLDDFKAINDRYGHLAGDIVLSTVSKALADFVRRPLDAIGRFGGDEFVAIWYDVDPQWFEDVQSLLLQRLTAAPLEEIPDLEGIRASGGAVLCYPDGVRTLQEALRVADNNLYGVKRDRAECVFLSRLGEPPAPPPTQSAA
jgi:diguanylate cyclase (GGDEF)-like protein